jgi:hypothetical protein
LKNIENDFYHLKIGQAATYTSFEKVDTLTEGSYTATFVYNSDNQRAPLAQVCDLPTIRDKLCLALKKQKILCPCGARHGLQNRASGGFFVLLSYVFK